jgi:hypothetical protein
VYEEVQGCHPIRNIDVVYDHPIAEKLTVNLNRVSIDIQNWDCPNEGTTPTEAHGENHHSIVCPIAIEVTERSFLLVQRHRDMLRWIVENSVGQSKGRFLIADKRQSELSIK